MGNTRQDMALTRAIRFGLMLAGAWLSTLTVSAQAPADRVNQMTTEAMEAYNNLDIDRAGTMLVEAIEFANQNGVGGPPLARANMNLGVVYVGGLGDNTNGLVHFLAAVCADANIQLDPLTSTPDIQSVFQLAQQRAQGGGCAGGGAAPAPGPTPVQEGGGPGPIVPGPPAATSGELIHSAPAQQRSQTPLPLYVEAPLADVEKVHLYYKGLGMDAFKRVDMLPYGAGYAYQLSCQDVWEPRISYYIAVLGDDGRVLATAGSAQAPIEVAVSSSATSAQLPDAAPPASCAADECPPGLAGCAARGIAAIAEPCESSSDCQSGLICSDDVCALAGAGAEEDEEDGPGSTDFARFFLQIGGTLGFAYAQAGMTADTAPPPGGNPRDVYENNSPWVAKPSECPSAGPDDGSPDGYCVSVPTVGFVPNIAIRAALGYFVAPWLSLAAIIRYQPDHGVGQFPGMLLGGRAEIMLTSPKATGFSMSLFAGGTMGTIHVKPAPKDAQWDAVAPYIISGLGGAHLGTNMRYRFARNVGVFLAPELDVQFPLFLFNIDMTAGLELAL